MATESKASCGQALNQSIVQHVTRDGNCLSLARKTSPIGLVEGKRTDFRNFDFIYGTYSTMPGPNPINLATQFWQKQFLSVCLSVRCKTGKNLMKRQPVLRYSSGDCVMADYVTTSSACFGLHSVFSLKVAVAVCGTQKGQST